MYAAIIFRISGAGVTGMPMIDVVSMAHVRLLRVAVQCNAVGLPIFNIAL